MQADAQTFAAVASADRAKLINLCLGILRNPEDAEDAVQSGLTTAWRGIEHFRGDSSLSTWLYRAVQNAALNQLRRRKSHRYEDHIEIHQNVPANQCGQEAWLLMAERVQQLYLAIESKRIPIIYRDLLRAEVTEKRGPRTGFQRGRRHRAIIALRKILAPSLDCK